MGRVVLERFCFLLGVLVLVVLLRCMLSVRCVPIAGTFASLLACGGRNGRCPGRLLRKVHLLLHIRRMWMSVGRVGMGGCGRGMQ
uniref:Putative secreted protein n=1 Tax=Anopheles darlingi TaxID=43151 RepID=A0A2M4DR37_ANODA